MRKTVSFTKHRILGLCFTIAFLLVSCSGDDNGDDNNSDEEIVALPSDLLGTYRGGVNDTVGLISESVEYETGSATIMASGTKRYTITFSDDVATIENVRFITLQGTSFLFNDQERRLVITLETTEDGDFLGVAKASDPVVTFAGGK